jgi:hypothetical protein
VFPARYELNSYVVYRKRLVYKRLTYSVIRRVKEDKDLPDVYGHRV